MTRSGPHSTGLGQSHTGSRPLVSDPADPERAHWGEVLETCPGPTSWQLAPTPSGPTEFPELEPQRERWEQRQQWRRQRLRHRYQRSVSKEKWVETLVVADAKMVEYHGQPNVESYVLTIMNMVRLPQAACGGGW